MCRLYSGDTCVGYTVVSMCNLYNGGDEHVWLYCGDVCAGYRVVVSMCRLYHCDDCTDTFKPPKSL